MRKLLTTWICLLCFIVSAFGAVTQSTAHQKAYQHIKNAGLSSEYVFLCKKTKANTIKITGNSTIVLSEDCWCFFLDKTPNDNWSHPCQYIFVSVSSGNVKSSNASMPPADFNEWEKSSYSKYSQGTNVLRAGNSVTDYVDSRGLVKPGIFNNLAQGCRETKDFTGKSYAVIISGGANSLNNHLRYWNDCSIYYQMLTRLYNIPKENIMVFMSDGTSNGIDLHLGSNYDHEESIYYIDSPKDLDGDGTNDINGAALYNDIKQGFQTLKSKLTANDNLFIFTTDHGSSDGSLCLWNNTSLTTTQFKNMLSGIEAPISIVMEQCYSGAFIYPIETLGQRISIATAEVKNQTSSGSFYYNPFAYKYACAFSGYDPFSGTTVNADKDGDGQITFQEAFEYSRYASYSDIAQYWSYGGTGYGSSTVDVFSVQSNYMKNVGQLGNYQTSDATFGCDYSSQISGAPSKVINITGTISNATKTYNAGYKINVKCDANNSNLTLKACDRIVFSKSTHIKSTKMKAQISKCETLRSLNVEEDEFSEDSEYTIPERIEFIDMNEVEVDAITIFPNPTTGEFTIFFGNESEEGNSVVITDLAGKVVYSAEGLGNEVSINLSDKAKGVYIVKAITNGNIRTEKLILK